MELSKNLPCELVEEILQRLPVKFLKRFQCVAESWCLLINNDLFIKSQLERSLSTNSSRHLIMSDRKVFSLDLEGPGNIQVIERQFPMESTFQISSSCNGLVLVDRETPILWNPLSGDWKVLSRFTNVYDIPILNVSYGFAYDSINEDYKIVKVLEQGWHGLVSVETMIYRLKSDSWKRIENFTYHVSDFSGNWRFQINGTLHAIVKRTPNSAKIMAFSVETETHYELELPSCTDTDLKLDTLGGCLSVISKNQRQISIWVMKDYGVAKSWTKLLSLHVSYHIDSFDNVKPLMYSKDGDKVMLIYNEEDLWENKKDTKLVWFDLRKKTTEDFYVEGLPDLFRAQACVSCLVSLH